MSNQNTIYNKGQILAKEPDPQFPVNWQPVSWHGTMKNVQIVVTDNATICVIADTKRFGKHQIMFEGRTLMEACDYIRRTTGKNHFKIQGLDAIRKFQDPDGRMMPWIMDVIL